MRQFVKMANVILVRGWKSGPRRRRRLTCAREEYRRGSARRRRSVPPFPAARAFIGGGRGGREVCGGGIDASLPMLRDSERERERERERESRMWGQIDEARVIKETFAARQWAKESNA
jgi:hypothetical protein